MIAPLLSIITPIYNIDLRLIDRLLESLYTSNIDIGLFEVLLIDDGSEPPVDLNLLSHFDAVNLRLFRQENRGLGAARNRAIPEAEGKYLYFVDADDYLFSENLPSLVRHIQADHYDVVIVRWEKVQTEKRILSQNGSEANHKWNSGIEYGKQNHWNGGIARYLFSRRMVDRNDLLFPEGVWHEDELFITKALFYAQNILESHLSVYAYYLRPDSITQKKSTEAVSKRVSDRLTALRQVDRWIATLPRLRSTESAILYKKRDFLIVDFWVSLCKESLPYDLFYEQYALFVELRYLPLQCRPYGLKYRLFRAITRYPELLYQLSPIIKKTI